MLKISTKTRYAIRALVEMANDSKQLHLLDQLALHQNISRKYLENIFALLKKGSIVQSKVGKNGGFYLREKLETITLLRIYELMEGEVEVVSCRSRKRSCPRLSFCPVSPVWSEVSAQIKKTLASKSLKDLCEINRTEANCEESKPASKKRSA
jgi:Rrf2 family protein